MIKPLLKIIPALSGNAKLACDITDYEKISDDEFVGISRVGHIYPLTSKFYQKYIDVSFLNGSWEYDISKFYNGGYSDTFYNDVFSFDKNNILYLNNTNNVISDRNTDYCFGCKRVSFDKTGYQFNFFAPFYCDSKNDLPDAFKIDIDLQSDGIYHCSKTIYFDFTKQYKYNHFNAYINRYFAKIDDNVIYMLPNTKQAVYYGIDVWLGGFNKYIDNIISKIYTEETTINEYDKCICDGFKRNNLIMRQIMPLSFYFNISDILTDTEKIRYKNAKLSIKGEYIKNDKQLPFYMIDDNYTNLNISALQIDTNSGEYAYKYISDNVFSFSDKLAVRTDNVLEYKFNNKINKEYNRWKLKYSSDENPYYTNTNYNFSKAQNLTALYYEYPQNYYWGSLFCNTYNNEINLLLPLGENIKNYYSDNNDYLLRKYNTSMNNYISSWFDMTDELSIENIIEHTNWADVHPDNKILYKGILYNFNSIYDNTNISSRINKFAILTYVDDSTLYSKDNIKNYIHSNYCLQNNIINEINVDIISTDYLSNVSLRKNLYDINNQQKNYKFNIDEYFTYNTNGEGTFVELESLGIDFYETNRYYDITDIDSIAYGKIEQTDIVEGLELLPITYITNIIDNDRLLPILQVNSSIYISYNNGIPTQLSRLNYTDEKRSSYLFYQKHKFVPGWVVDEINTTENIDPDKLKNKEYIYYPNYSFNNYQVSNVFVKCDRHNLFYGNKTTIDHIDSDNDVLYVDPYKIKEKLENYNSLSGNLYIKDISNSYITLSNFNDSKNIFLFVTDSNKQIILDKLSYTTTYAMQEKYNYSKFNIENVITNINAIYITKQEYEDISEVSYSKLVNIDNTWIKQTFTYYIPNGEVITAFTYNFDYTDTIITNNVEFDVNPTKNSTYISGYMYVSNIEKNNINNEYSLYLTDITNKNNEIRISCATENELMIYAYKCGAASFINGSYINNQNCIGTYMWRKSYIYAEYDYQGYYLYSFPQNVITKISNLTYIANYDKDSDIYSYSVNNCISKDIDFSIETYYITDPKTQKKYCPDYSGHQISVYNPNLPDNEIYVKNILFEIKDTQKLYGKFMNTFHLLIFIKYINQYAIDKNNSIIDNESVGEKININDYIYIKKTVVLKSAKNNNIDIKHIYIPVSSKYGETNLLTILNNPQKYLFSIKGESEVFELYFKKEFIKINKSIFDNVISLNTNHYKDLYIYRLEKNNDSLKDIKYVSIDNVEDSTYVSYCSLYYTTYYNSYSIVPLFDNVLKQQMESTVIYNSYILNMISDVNFIDKTTYSNITTLYRYNMPNKLCLIDVSNIPYVNDKLEYRYIFNTSYQSFIYNKCKEIINTYSYTTKDNKGNMINVYVPEKNQISYTYYSDNIETFDKNPSISTSFVNIVNTEHIDFDKFRINTYSYNGNVYGFYINKVSLQNVNTIFNLTFTDFTNVKYFTMVNGKSIINNHKYLTKVFKNLLPVIKHNVLNQLYNIPILNYQYKTMFNKKYKNVLSNNGDNLLSITKNNIDSITLYRYYDSIVPYIFPTVNLYDEYALKTKAIKDIPFDTNIYQHTINIYNYPGIRVYRDENNFETLKQIEYKFFNDNQFINLETNFDIFIGDELSEIELLEYQEDNKIIDKFELYINRNRKNKFTKDEILFLYNKYTVILASNSEKLNDDYSGKLYSLIYKFSLK